MRYKHIPYRYTTKCDQCYIEQESDKENFPKTWTTKSWIIPNYPYDIHKHMDLCPQCSKKVIKK